MLSRKPRSRAARENTDIVTSERDFFKELKNLYRYASAHSTESHSYPFYNHILMAFRATCLPPQPDAMVSCHPQGTLMSVETDVPDRERRIPDYLMTVTFDQPGRFDDPGYRKALLMFLWEVKPYFGDWDDSMEAQSFAKDGLLRNIDQLSEQAYCAFREYACHHS
ncbi:hypothetical protein EVG20_g11233 [Dentipellis fragilis]|uniref:Uncharacterized protein n=1 Tax=Dentipellis fragilis TaxID=205917 RepID=A0A4Y9XLM3_9AGAM|nr:hypothetical protein EVG20_g11233 [Dentipellis fragilis]